MKRLLILFWFSLVTLSPLLLSQSVEYIGLANKHLTSLKIGEGLIAVGTNSNGVYWQNLYAVSDTAWKMIELKGVNVETVYPHKSGPVGWAIGIGAKPNLSNKEFIFCSFMGGTVRTMSYGIDTNNTESISGIDGFPDPTICGETFAIGGRKLYRRYFNDTTWQTIYSLSFEGYFSSLKAREENAYVYAGGGEGFTGILLIRSSDKGNTWENLYPNCFVYDLDFYGQSNHTIFVTDQRQISRSLDSGLNWSKVFSTDSLRIQKISFSRNGNIIYAVANTNAFYDLPGTYLLSSSDDGNNWQVNQLPIYDIIIGMDVDYDNYIYLASISSGVFRLKSPIVNVDDNSVDNFPGEFKLYQNFPNPFNPSTTIRYSVISSQNVSLKVFNVLGEEVAMLVNEIKAPGNYQAVFDASKLSSGIYYYELKSGSFRSLKGMIVIK